MTRSSSAPPASAKTELETVVNWPLVVSAAALAFVALAVPLVLACIAGWKGDVVKDPVASRPIMPELQSTTKATHTSPAPIPRPPLLQKETAKSALPRQVYVKSVKPPIPANPTPIPVVVKHSPVLPPAQNPILQLPQRKESRFNHFHETSATHPLSLLAYRAREVDLESVTGTREALLAKASKDKDCKRPIILALRDKRPDLRGLPMREGADCQAPPEAVKKMQEISITFRRKVDQRPRRATADQIQNLLRTSKNWFEEDGLSTLGQMLQVEDTGSRLEFVKRLAQVKGAKAGVMLARQALFDPAWTVREEAIQALTHRPADQYRELLLDGLRYPWPPVAAHAAEALAALEDRDSIPHLAALLDEPDPCAPRRDKNNKWVVAEVVRINHLRNCLLCHAPSSSTKDPMRAFVPTPGEPLPRVYYGTSKGDFVRADITYLRQDFSLMERVEKPDKWPEWQRFDYLVRTRELTAEELAAWKDKARKSPSSSYPQRDAVLFALRELTGQDAGEKSTDWYDLLYTLELSNEH